MKRIALVLLLATNLFADPVTDSRKLQREALEAYKAKDYATFLAKIRGASDLRPDHPTLLYYLAGAYTMNGRNDEALSTLERVGRMGMVYEIAKEADFEPLRTDKRFEGVVEAFKKNAQPIGKASRAFTTVMGLITEGLAYDGQRFFVGSVRTGTIRTKDGGTFAGPTGRGVFGLAIDRKRRLLWAATSVVEQNVEFREEDKGRAAVIAFGLDDGKVRSTFEAPEGKHLFGDLTLAPNGDVYISDSTTPAIYRISSGKLELFKEGEPFLSLQGLAVRDKTLYVADYSKGIFAIDLATRDAHLLAAPRDATLLGVDGLYAPAPGVLIATQNGVNPHRVIRIALKGTTVNRVDTLVANHPDFDEPTLGVVAGRDFYFNAASQFELFGDRGAAKDESKIREGVVLRVKW